MSQFCRFGINVFINNSTSILYILFQFCNSQLNLTKFIFSYMINICHSFADANLNCWNFFRSRCLILGIDSIHFVHFFFEDTNQISYTILLHSDLFSDDILFFLKFYLITHFLSHDLVTSLFCFLFILINPNTNYSTHFFLFLIPNSINCSRRSLWIFLTLIKFILNSKDSFLCLRQLFL